MFDINNEKRKLSLSGASSEPIISAESKRNQAMSFLRLRGASGAQGNSTPASCRKAHKRRFIFNSRKLRIKFSLYIK